MVRRWLWLLLSGLGALGCGPDRHECTGPHADFIVTLKLRDRPLSTDTVVHVTYGGSGMEDYSLQESGATHEVVFCRPLGADGTQLMLDAGTDAAAGASGRNEAEVDQLSCELWTAGFAKLEVRSAAFATMTYELTPRDRPCTVSETIVLDSPDGG